MENCDYCGEYNKVRKKYNPIGKHIGEFIMFDYICEKCDKVKTILKLQELKEYKKLEKSKQMEWVKFRDKFAISGNSGVEE